MTVRDLLALRLVGRAGHATASHLAAYIGASNAVARRRLATLRDLGMIVVNITAMEAENRYVLTPRGKARICAHFGVSEDALPIVRGIARTNLRHHDHIVSAFVALSVATARSTTFTLEAFFFEGELRRRLSAKTGGKGLVPDAVAVVRTEDGRRLACAIEVDEATENPSLFRSHKAGPLGVARRERRPLVGVESWVVLVLAPSARRAQQLAGACWSDNRVPERLFYFGVADRLDDRTVLDDANWWTPRLVGERALLVRESPFAVFAEHHGRPAEGEQA